MMDFGSGCRLKDMCPFLRRKQLAVLLKEMALEMYSDTDKKNTITGAAVMENSFHFKLFIFPEQKKKKRASYINLYKTVTLLN